MRFVGHRATCVVLFGKVNVRVLIQVAMRAVGWGRRLVAAIALVALGYGAAGLAGGAIPANRDWRPAARPERDGVTIWVESNGIHTGFVLPKLAAGVDWRDVARADDLADPRYARHDHVAIGWGEKRFFLETPDWASARPGRLLGAAIGSDATLLHVEHVAAPARPAEDERRVVLTPDEYRRLAAYIRASLKPGGRRYRGYGADDAFYEAVGHYSARTTCNEWTGAALRHAGVRVGAWTPFPATVLGWFPIESTEGRGRRP